MREILRRQDEEAPPGRLTRDLLDAVGCPDLRTLMQRFYDDLRPDAWAAHVPGVLGAGEPFGAPILDSAAQALAGLAASCSRQLNAPPDLLVVLAGGLLTGHPARTDRTRDHTRRPCPATRADPQPGTRGRAVALAHAAATTR